MQQVCSAVVADGIFAALADDIGLHTLTHAHIPFANLPVMDNQPFERAARVLHREDAHRAAEIAAIANLPAAFRVEWCGIQDHQRGLRRANLLDLDAIDYERLHLAAAGNALVAGELRRADALENIRQRGLVLALREGGGRAAAFLLALHRLLKAGDIDGEAVFRRHFLRQFQREAVRVVQLEGLFSRNSRVLTLLQILDQVIEQEQASIQRLAEFLLFQAQNLDDAVAL